MMLPTNGQSRDELFATLDGYRRDDIAWRTGKTFGFVYDPGPEVEAVAKQAFCLYLSENGLDPTSFPSLLRIENEVMAIARAQLGAGPEAAGAFTSGGTESILLAVKAARDLARAARPDVREPEMVLPETAHAAFHKAAAYFGVRPVVTAVDPRTMAADPDAVRAAVGPRTILVVASAPSYAHGVVDPVREIAAVAAERDIPCHVDACVGGWLLPYFRRLGSSIPEYDFRVPGVTSMSMDLHKYAFTPKGASVVMYRSAAMRRHQIFVCAGWAGYSVINMTVQSSKSGGPLAAAWAVLRYLGDSGYLDLARRVRDATAALVGGIDAIPGLRVVGRPDLCVLAFTSDDASVFHVADEMRERGWYVQPQLRRGASPETLHLTVGPTNVPWIEAFLADLAASHAAARELPSPLSLPVDLSAGLPRRQAALNAQLNELPPAQVERLLAEYWGQIFH
jgi:sphinganine-1-phosphate aldolase